MRVVVLFKNVLFDEKSKERDRFVENDIDFCFSFLCMTSLARRRDATNERLTPLRPFLRFSSMNNEIYSGALRFAFTNTVNA